MSCVFRNPTVDASRNRAQVKLLPELLSEGDGCVGTDGVSPLSRTALLMGKVRVVDFMSAIRVVPQSFMTFVSLVSKEIKVFFIKFRHISKT